MTDGPYIPRPDSLAQRVVAHLQLHPEVDGLTLSDMTDLFDVTRGNIHTQLSLCIQNDLLKREQNDDSEYVYSRGKAFTGIKASGQPAPAAATKTAPAPKALRALAGPLDLATLPIDDNIPVPTGQPGKKTDYGVLLKRLAPGQSAALPRRNLPGLRKEITEWHKAQRGTFVTRTLSTVEIRVWRTA